MALIGLLLLAAAAVVGIDVATQNTQPIDVDAFGTTIGTNVGSVLVAGVVIALVGALGAFLLTDGLRRRRARRHEIREREHEHKKLAATVEEERAARERAEAEARAARTDGLEDGQRHRVAAEAEEAEVHAEAAKEAARSDVDLRDMPPPPPPRGDRERGRGGRLRTR